MAMTEIKIRALNRKDRVTLSAMLVKLADRLKSDDILRMVTRGAAKSAESTDGKEADGSTILLGVQIIKTLLDTLEDDMTAWFASLLDITVEDLNAMPFDTDLKVIEQLKSQPDFADFFAGASRLFNGING